VSIQGGYGQGGEPPTGVTYGGRKIAQAIILDGLENASQEVYAVLLEVRRRKDMLLVLYYLWAG